MGIRRSVKTIAVLIGIWITVEIIHMGPVGYAAWKTPAGYVFSGQASWFDPWDVNVYSAFIKWGQEGHWLAKSLYTTASHKPVLIYPLYVIAGRLIPFVGAIKLFHILAAIIGGLLVWGLFKLFNDITQRPNLSLFLTLLTSVGSGWGWLVYPRWQAADLFMTGFNFYSQFQRGHEGLGMLAYLVAVWMAFKGIEGEKLKEWIIGILSLGIALISYPYYFLSYWLIVGGYAVWKVMTERLTRNTVIGLGVISGISSFIVYGMQKQISSNPGFKDLLSHRLVTPNILEILIGWGVLSVFLIWQLIKGVRNKKSVFLNIWIWTSVLLAYLPFNFGRFYLRGLMFPILALVGLNWERLKLKLRFSNWSLGLLLVIFLVQDTLFIGVKRLVEANKFNPWFYIKTDKAAALSFIKQSKTTGVLSGYYMGNLIPAKTGKAVFFGYLFKNFNTKIKIKELIKFYAGRLNPKEAERFLKENKIDLIIVSDEEKRWLKKEGKLEKIYPFLKLVWQQKEIEIYKYLGPERMRNNKNKRIKLMGVEYDFLAFGAGAKKQ